MNITRTIGNQTIIRLQPEEWEALQMQGVLQFDAVRKGGKSGEKKRYTITCQRLPAKAKEPKRG